MKRLLILAIVCAVMGLAAYGFQAQRGQGWRTAARSNDGAGHSTGRCGSLRQQCGSRNDAIPAGGSRRQGQQRLRRPRRQAR